MGNGDGAFESAAARGGAAIEAGLLADAQTAYAEAVDALDASIVAFGDSHFRYFVGVPGCAPLWLGAITMHSIGRDAFIRPAA